MANMTKISVAISTYDDPRDMVYQCIESLINQEKVYEIIVVDSSEKDEIYRLCKLYEKILYIYTPPKGLSDARNIGVANSKNEIVAFTDSDCIVDKDWSSNILNVFDNDVSIVGGKVSPKWSKKTNPILVNSVISQGFYSLFDMGNKIIEVDQIFGANFAINKALLGEKEIFETDFGRRKEDLLGGEETQLCNKVIGKSKIVYNPSALVWHQIPEERSKLKWMLNRIYYGGKSRATIGGAPTPKHTDKSYNIYDFLFLSIFFIPYIYGYIEGRFKSIRKKTKK